MRGRGIGGGSIFQFTYLEAHVAHHGDPEPLDVCGDHVGVKVLGQYLVVNQCHGRCSPLFWIVILAFGDSLK